MADGVRISKYLSPTERKGHNDEAYRSGGSVTIVTDLKTVT